MPKNKFTDLNNHLFAQLERLGEEDLAGEKLGEEIKRAKAIEGVAKQIIANGTLVLKAHVAASEKLPGGEMPSIFALESKENIKEK